MFENFNFFTTILVFSIINVLLMALPELFCWFNETFEKRSINFVLDTVKINFFSIFSSIVFFILEIVLLLFTFFSNGFLISLQLILFQMILFIAICIVPKVIYSMFFYLFETFKLMFDLAKTVFELVATSIAITLFIPYIFLSYIYSKVFKKRNK